MRAFRQIVICISVAIGLLGGNVQAATKAEIAAFLANPAQTLASNPNGGAALISFIRDVAIGDPTALPAIINLLKSASADQQSAIGTGLGQAATIVGKTDQTYAGQIQQAVAASGAEGAIGAYAMVTGNVTTGVGGGGGGGGVGGPTFGFAGGTGGSGGSGSFGSGSTSKPGQTTVTGSPN